MPGRLRAAILSFVLATQLPALAQSASQPWFNPDLPRDRRVDALIAQMTLGEKASQMVNQARAIPRLGTPPTIGGARGCTAWRGTAWHGAGWIGRHFRSYGLSFTRFAYDGLTLPATLKASGSLAVDVRAKNVGRREGDAVPQAYLSFPDVPDS